MITRQGLQPHGNRIEQYFEYILEKQIKKEDIRGLIKMLSQRQRNHFAMWLDDYTACKWHHSHIDTVKSILFNL